MAELSNAGKILYNITTNTLIINLKSGPLLPNYIFLLLFDNKFQGRLFFPLYYLCGAVVLPFGNKIGNTGSN